MYIGITKVFESSHEMDLHCSCRVSDLLFCISDWMSSNSHRFECHDWTVKLEASDAVEIVHLVKSDCVTALHSRKTSMLPRINCLTVAICER